MIATGATRPEGANLPRDAATPGKDATPVLVVLVTADTIGGGDADVALMRKTICRAEPAARVLLLVTRAEGVALAHKLADAKIELELLLAPEIAGDLPPVVHARVPPNTRSGDQEDFALALADVVLADAGSHAHGLVRRARYLGKPVIPPGHGLPVLPPIESVADRLDPLALPGHKWRGQICGRLEQFFVRLLGLFAVQEEPFDKRWARLRECFRRDGKWRPESNFAPACCEPLAPDNGGYHATSPLVTRFDVLDRSAVFGAYMHREFWRGVCRAVGGGRRDLAQGLADRFVRGDRTGAAADRSELSLLCPARPASGSLDGLPPRCRAIAHRAHVPAAAGAATRPDQPRYLARPAASARRSTRFDESSARRGQTRCSRPRPAAPARRRSTKAGGPLGGLHR